MTMTSNTDISLKNFFIYDVSFGQTEGHEEEKVLYFYPRGSKIDIQMKEVGLSEAIVKFTETFSNDPCDTLQTLKTKKFFFNPEENIWLIMTVNLPTCLVGKEKLDGIEYLPNEVQNPVFLAVLRQAYLAAKLFLGPFQRLIDKENGSPDLLKKKLDFFFTKYLLSLNLKKCDIIDLFQGVQFLPLDKPTFLHSQCFINLVEANFPVVQFSILLYNEQLVWSGLPAEDAQVIYRYLVSSLLPCHLSLSSDGKRPTLKPNRLEVESLIFYPAEPSLEFLKPLKIVFDYAAPTFVTGPENLSDIDITFTSKVPRVYLAHIPQPGFFSLVVYRIHQTTMSLLIPGNETMRLDFYRRLDSFLSKRLEKINTELSEYKELPNACSSSNSSDSVDQDIRYVYFNSMNLATKSTLDKNRDLGGQQTVPKELLRLLVDLHQHQKWLAESGNSSNETMIKTVSDHWVVGKMSNSRQFYITVEKKRVNLIEVNEEVRKLCDQQLKSIFFHV